MFLVTGGGSGIGRALAYALADRQQPVLVVGRRKDKLIETSHYSSLIRYFQADVTQASERLRLVEHLADQSLQGLVHNAAVIQPITPLSAITETDWSACLDTNLNAPLFLSQALLPKLQQGRVLHIGSGAAYNAIVSWAPYCVTKAALAMLTRCWQVESNSPAFASVMPGIIDTTMQQEIRESTNMTSSKHDFFMRLKRENRLLTVETVAAFLCWLLLDINQDEYVSQEWDIYDTTHHARWLKPPHVVPNFE